MTSHNSDNPLQVDDGATLVNPPDYRNDTVLPLPPAVSADAWAVDAACSGNPGKMEYRGVDLATGQEVFHYGPVYGTNNIGEFLAIVHALALMEREGLSKTIYSDSFTAMTWVRKGQCKTKLEHGERTAGLHEMIARAESWLSSHDFRVPITTWDTKAWGEIPADFGRKGRRDHHGGSVVKTDPRALFSLVKGIKSRQDACLVFEEIANALFKRFHIALGGVEYRLLEIEFYYHCPGHEELKTDGTLLVYDRNCERAGSFFVHSGGVDICFETLNDGERRVSYGGILIRSMLRMAHDGGRASVVTGPYDCLEALFDFTDGEMFPKLEAVKEEFGDVRVVAVRRCEDETSARCENYCYYNDYYHEGDDWSHDGEPLGRYKAATGRIEPNDYAFKPWNPERRGNAAQ